MSSTVKTITGIDINDSQLLATLVDLVAWMLAGRAVFTLYNKLSGARITFKLKCHSKRTERGGHVRTHTKGPWDVEARIGGAFVKVGTLKRHTKGGTERLLFRRSMSKGSEVDTMSWLTRRINAAAELPSPVLVWRANQCCRCGLELTTEYKLIGIGPVCCGHMGIDAKEILSIKDEDARIEAVRKMAYQHHLTTGDKITLRLLPQTSIARHYAEGHGLAA